MLFFAALGKFKIDNNINKCKLFINVNIERRESTYKNIYILIIRILNTRQALLNAQLTA